MVDIIEDGASNSSTNGIAGDLYTWVKGNYSTNPDFPNGYIVAVLKRTAKLDLIPAQKSPRSLLSEGWQTNYKNGKESLGY